MLPCGTITCLLMSSCLLLRLVASTSACTGRPAHATYFCRDGRFQYARCVLGMRGTASHAYLMHAVWPRQRLHTTHARGRRIHLPVPTARAWVCGETCRERDGHTLFVSCLKTMKHVEPVSRLVNSYMCIYTFAVDNRNRGAYGARYCSEAGKELQVMPSL